MLKKMLLAVSGLAILAASTANAGGPAPAPVPVYPATITIKVKGTDDSFQSGASKIISGSANNQKLIRLAMGNDIDVPVQNEKNFVLGYVPDGAPNACNGDYVVWDKVALRIAGMLGYSDSCDESNFQSAKPPLGKNGTESYLGSSKIIFEDTSENCSSLNKSQLSGRIHALGLSTVTIRNNTRANTGLKHTRLVGDVYHDGLGLTVVDGSVSIDFKKKLGASDQSRYVECNP